MPKILLVRLSSMGDVIHNLPAVSDIAHHYPNAELHWVVEEGFAQLPALHPAIKTVIPFALRRWRKQRNWAAWREFCEVRDRLRSEHYDLVIDSQGLLKSAMLTHLCKAPSVGYDRHSIREPLASWAYDKKIAVGRTLTAIERNRRLCAAALGYAADTPLDYGLNVGKPAFASDYVVLLTATSRDDKLWPEADWIALAQDLCTRGLKPVLPWGGAHEKARAERIVQAVAGAQLAPKLDLREAAGLLAGARIVVGVDTGLVHLAAALGVPTVALFCASEPGLTGVMSAAYAVNLGSNGAPPRLVDVLVAVNAGLAA